MKDNSKLSDVSWLRVVLFIVVCVLLSSCSYNMTPRQAEINYELEKAYLEYSYQRDSLFVEYNKVLINKE